MSDLRTDFKDDVLNITTNEKRKYRMINNADGTVSFEDVTDYVVQGDTFGATEVNQITEKVNSCLTRADVVDNAESTATDLPASANQIRLAHEKIDNHFAYSTEEKECGKWIDGKTLYKRTVTFTNTTAEETIITDIPVSMIDTIFISGESFCKKGVVYIPVNVSNGTNSLNDFGLFLAKKDTEEFVNLEIRNGSNGTDYTYYVTLMYTKK
jgi:hypothetical protein